MNIHTHIQTPTRTRVHTRTHTTVINKASMQEHCPLAPTGKLNSTVPFTLKGIGGCILVYERMCRVGHDGGIGVEGGRMQGGGGGAGGGMQWDLKNNKVVVDPCSPILCSECWQCVTMFFFTTGATPSALSSQTVPSAGKLASDMLLDWRSEKAAAFDCAWLPVVKNSHSQLQDDTHAWARSDMAPLSRAKTNHEGPKHV